MLSDAKVATVLGINITGMAGCSEFKVFDFPLFDQVVVLDNYLFISSFVSQVCREDGQCQCEGLLKPETGCVECTYCLYFCYFFRMLDNCIYKIRTNNY